MTKNDKDKKWIDKSFIQDNIKTQTQKNDWDELVLLSSTGKDFYQPNFYPVQCVCVIFQTQQKIGFP